MRELLAHRLKNGAGFLERRRVAADEERERSFTCPFLSAGDRRVEERDPAIREARGDGPRGLGGDGGAVHHDGAARCAFGGAAFSEVNFLHLGRIGHARDDHVGGGAHVGGTAHRGDPLRLSAELLCQRFRLRVRPRREGDGKAGFREVPGHAETHGPEADESDAEAGRCAHGASEFNLR